VLVISALLHDDEETLNVRTKDIGAATLEFRAPDRLREATHLLEPKAAEVENHFTQTLFLAR
jgi:hypothetical protein